MATQRILIATAALLAICSVKIADARSLRSKCVTDTSKFCSLFANGQYSDPCDLTCNAYINCWGGLGVRQTCPPATPLFNNNTKVSLYRSVRQ